MQIKGNPVSILLRIRKAGNLLNILIKDDGQQGGPVNGKEQERKGIGLSNLKQRLELIYEYEVTFQFGYHRKGFRTLIELPFQQS